MDGIVRELHQAGIDGKLWGDIEYEWELERQEAETPEQKAQKALNALMDKMKSDQALKEYKMNKFVNRQTGQIISTPRKKMCKYADTPATVDKHGVKWAAGCELKRAGKCPFLHPGDEGYEEMKNGTFNHHNARHAPVQRGTW
jgi:hypothetical protein